jgi:two-component system LytT family response regulator
MKTLSRLQFNNEQLLIILNNITDIVDQNMILYLKATDNYTNVYLRDNSFFLVSKTLKTIESQLNQDYFYRCHKSFTVNLSYIKQIYTRDTIYLIISDCIKIPISKRKLVPLKQRISQKIEKTVPSQKYPDYSQKYPVY